MRATVGLLFSILIGAINAQNWVQLPDFPGTARDDAASFSINGIIYVGTGMEVGWALTNDWYAFNTQTETWSTVASLPATTRQYCTTFVDHSEGKGYLFGGVDASGALNELWEYDPPTDQWTQRASLPAEARYACVGWDNSAFTPLCHIVTGMLASGLPTNELWAYDTQTDSWSQRLSLPGLARHRATGAVGGGSYVFGGADQDFNALEDIWGYGPPPFEAWYLDLSNTVQQRYGAKCITGVDYLDTSIPFIIGGAQTASDFLDDVVVYSYPPDLIPVFPAGGRRGGAAGRDAGGANIYFGTGLSESMERQNDWWRLGVEYLGIEEASSSFKVHPNPGTTDFTVSSASPLPKIVVVFNSQGQEVLRDNVPPVGRVDMQSMPSGLYHVRLIDQTGRTTCIRWIKL